MTLWILSEERPKSGVIKSILKLYSEDKDTPIDVLDSLSIEPQFSDGSFTHEYVVQGVTCKEIDEVKIKIIKGKSSFVDFLAYEGGVEPPAPNEKPEMLIEETKTADSESRNTGVYQRASKFVYGDFFYPDVSKIMLYNLRVSENEELTDTNKFGTKLLKTIGVRIVGKNQKTKSIEPFSSINEIIDFKNSMDKPPGSNTPIELDRKDDRIEVSGRLYKSGYIAHDPNIGALTLIAKALRSLGWEKDIVITKHGLEQDNVTSGNKFILKANKIGISLQGLEVPKANVKSSYWKYEENSEKIASILLSLLVKNDSNLDVIYENHAGGERGYFIDEDDNPNQVQKYIERDQEKGIIPIPDLIIRDKENKSILLLEGKRSKKLNEGLNQLPGLEVFRDKVLERHYGSYRYEMALTIFGSLEKNNQIFFLLEESGKVYVNNKYSLCERIENIITQLGGKTNTL
jgi:hypothetical protein